MISARAALILCSVALASSASAQRERPTVRRNGLRADLVGCYALYSDSGRLDGSFYNSSPVVRLDTADGVPSRQHVPGFRTMIAMTAAFGPAKINALHPPSWSADSLTDSVRLSFVNGFSGAVLVLNAPRDHADTLVGRVFDSRDYGPPFDVPRGGAKAIRVSCS